MNLTFLYLSSLLFSLPFFLWKSFPKVPNYKFFPSLSLPLIPSIYCYFPSLFSFLFPFLPFSLFSLSLPFFPPFFIFPFPFSLPLFPSLFPFSFSPFHFPSPSPPFENPFQMLWNNLGGIRKNTHPWCEFSPLQFCIYVRVERRAVSVLLSRVSNYFCKYMRGGEVGSKV